MVRWDLIGDESDGTCLRIVSQMGLILVSELGLVRVDPELPRQVPMLYIIKSHLTLGSSESTGT